MPTLQLDETRWTDALHPSLIAGAHQRSRRWPTPAVPNPWRDDRFAEQTGPYTAALAGTLFTQSVTGQLPDKTYQTIKYLTHQRAIIDAHNPQSIKKPQEYRRVSDIILARKKCRSQSGRKECGETRKRELLIIPPKPPRSTASLTGRGPAIRRTVKNRRFTNNFRLQAFFSWSHPNILLEWRK